MVPHFDFLIARLWIVIFVIVLIPTSTTITRVHSKTDGPDGLVMVAMMGGRNGKGGEGGVDEEVVVMVILRGFSALNVMYNSMNSPSKLDGWKSSGGDPCGESWKGIKCSGSSITEIDLSDLGLTGSIGYQLSSLTSVTYFDLSKNNLMNDIPYQLPPNAVHIDLSENGFTGGVPYSISQMKDIKYLNIGHNQLKGQLSEMFSQLSKLTELLSAHSSCLVCLSSRVGGGDGGTRRKKRRGVWPSVEEFVIGEEWVMARCQPPERAGGLGGGRHLQNNQFTGSINVLANLPLDDFLETEIDRRLKSFEILYEQTSANVSQAEPFNSTLRTVNWNVANNKFTGWIPNELKDIGKIETGGNAWSSAPAPPPPPGQKSNPHADKPSSKDDKKSGMNGAAIAGIALGVLLALVIIIALLSRRSSTPPSHFLDEERISQRRPFTPLASQELSNDFHSEMRKDFREPKSSDSSSSITVNGLQTSLSSGLKPPSSDHIKSLADGEFVNPTGIKKSTSIRMTCYSLSDLQTATGNFATGRLLGEGTIGRVYRAKYADGKVFAVKKIDSLLVQGRLGDDFTQMVSNISKLHHPNIAELVGYCSEQGQNMLVFEYFRNGSLHEFLHLSDDFSKPLTWNTRVRIALGTARAVEYLHEVCSPSSVHKNIKSSNILLDTELNPCLSDCGLAAFHQRTSQNLGGGYNAPECTKPSAYTLKSDVYSFGVVMLELLTGRMPFDSSKPRLEQSLVRWATPQLHDIDALGKMVDPALRGLYPPKSVSRFADIIALCVQPEPEFRPPMSEVVEALVRLVQRSSMREDPGAFSLDG
ncbi:hypothetical protein U1Q18_006210 [Sarracenia purpurea var. burkii]